MSTLYVDDVAGQGGGTATNLMAGLSKARWRYNQGGPTVDESFNISSITDVTAGEYDPQITNAFSTDFYSLEGTRHSTGTGAEQLILMGSDVNNWSSSQLTCTTTSNTNVVIKSDGITSATLTGDLA